MSTKLQHIGAHISILFSQHPQLRHYQWTENTKGSSRPLQKTLSVCLGFIQKTCLHQALWSPSISAGIVKFSSILYVLPFFFKKKNRLKSTQYGPQHKGIWALFEHPFHIALTCLWGSGLHIMLMLVIETGYPIGDWLLLFNSLPDLRGKLQVCLKLQQLAAAPLG